MTGKLSASDVGFLHLIQRSPDIGNGWRTVSKTLWRLVDNFRHPELIESSGSSETGGRIRFSDRGLILIDYL